MLTPGRAWWLFNKARREGFLTPFYEHWVRRRILSTPPVQTGDDGQVEIHVLTSTDDWLNLLWALKSFYFFGGRHYPLVIHEDGSLPSGARQDLQAHFPGARLIAKAEADAHMATQLALLPRCARYRALHPLALKALDFSVYLSRPRLLILDSDVLFFAAPEELLRRLEDPFYELNCFNADIAPALNITAEEAQRRFGIALVDRANSGLAILHREALSLQLMEEFLGHDSHWAGHVWRIEQTLLALMASKHGAELLPRDYRVSLGGGIDGCVAKHYVGAVRHLMYREGMAYLVRSGFLTSLRNAGSSATSLAAV